MILNYTSISEQTNSASMSDWLAILQKNSKSTAQLQSEMIEGVSETIKDIQDKALENAKEAIKETNKESDDDIQTTEYSSEVDSFDDSAVSAEDLQSHIDIKV